MVFYFIFTPGEIIAAAVLLPLVGGLLVALRIRTRLQQVKKLGIEDWLVIPALALIIGMGIASIYGVAKKAEGYPLPAAEREPARRRTASQVFWNTEWMQPLALGCIKLSFILFYRRIFNVGLRSSAFNIVSAGALALMTIWMIGFTMSVLLICPGHVAAYWVQTSDRQKYCWDTSKFLYAFCWSDVGTDLIILLMPIPSIAKLHLPTRKKWGIAAIFALGAITILASITRGILFAQLLHTEKASELATLDPNMINTNGIYWMLLEAGLALIAVNLLPLYGIIAKQNVGSILRYARSFGSIRSDGSKQRQQSLDPSMPKSSNESEHRLNDIELVPGAQKSTSQVTHSQSLDKQDLETGNINVTKSYSVEQPL